MWRRSIGRRVWKISLSSDVGSFVASFSPITQIRLFIIVELLGVVIAKTFQELVNSSYSDARDGSRGRI